MDMYSLNGTQLSTGTISPLLYCILCKTICSLKHFLQKSWWIKDTSNNGVLFE